MEINYINGDIFEIATEPFIIAHVCNDLGGWGAGFTGQLDKVWIQPQKAYRLMAQDNTPNEMIGKSQLVKVCTNGYVANLVAQCGYKGRFNQVPLDYIALTKCLATLNQWALTKKCNVFMPKIGTGLGGGDWHVISQIITEQMSVDVTVCVL